ncbi:MAG: hypothetical protein WA082_03615 [Candidatus Moraniibacteriota bacterium]
MTFHKKWSLEIIRDGFIKFEKKFSRLPTGPEIDEIDYLPSSRQLHRLFGGLPQLRILLGYHDVDFSKGIHRSKIGLDSNKRSKASEDNLRDILFEKFHEPFVHLEKPIDKNRKLRVDFYVFNPIENFAVDIFTTETYHNLDTNVYIKLKKYHHIQERLYFVLLSENLTVGDVSLFIERRPSHFPSNIKLVTLDQFTEIIKSIPSYENPTIKSQSDLSKIP